MFCIPQTYLVQLEKTVILLKMDKSRIGVSLCCVAALLGTVAYAVSPTFATETFSIPSDGEVGEQYISGDMIIEIVPKEEVERMAS